MNSTGQYQSITNYRNATDVSYENVTSFLMTSGVEEMVYNDSSYRPVEYAALLHDDAEANGINCSIVASEVETQVPQHAVVAFHTTDRDMVYVDATAMNVSQKNYTVPFAKIWLLRKWWTEPAPWTNYNNRYVTIKTYRDAKPVNYDDLILFLNRDNTEDVLYVKPTYTCVDFSATLYNNAEANGIKCGLVSVWFEEPVPGHAFNAFQTTDKGIVYIDCTGVNETCKRDGYGGTDNNVYLQVGSQLGELPDNQTNGDLSYAFYAGRVQRINTYNTEMDQYNKDVEMYNDEVNRYEADLNDYNAQMSRHNSAVATFNSRSSEEYKSYLNGDITYDEYSNWYNTNSANIPPAPTGGGSLDSRKSNLYYRSTSLDNRRAELMSREERKWITFNPMGTVSNVDVYWG